MYLIHITTAGERWDQIAMRYYGDALAYERIIVANSHIPLTAVLQSGLILSIPITEINGTQAAVPPWLR